MHVKQNPPFFEICGQVHKLFWRYDMVKFNKYQKISVVVVAVLLASTLCYGKAKKAVEKFVLNNQKDKVSYSIGYDIANTIKKQEIDVNVKALVKGLNDGLNGTKAMLTEDEMRQVFATLQQEMTAKRMEREQKLAEKNRTEGEAFLNANKAKEGVTALPSGLQYKEITAGTGATPTADDTVIVNYKGTLIDGTEFDSSYKRGEPLKIQVSSVIPGWTEALKLMKVGAKWQLFIPSDLAYGERGAGSAIGPNSTLIFEVELVGISPKESPAPTAQKSETKEDSKKEVPSESKDKK
jgi:FKBP-type peptidyl-prolyl cis-trans isomerase